MMDTDKRLSRGERSGRYGPDNMRDDMDWHERPSGYVERDYDRGRAGDRHRDRLDDCRDSPERGQKRGHCDSSDDEYDGDRPDQDHKTVQRERNKPIVLRGLPFNITEEEIRAALEQLQGPQPASIGVFGKKTGKSHHFAVMEFYHMQDSTRWMETNQNMLVIRGKRVSVKYSWKRAIYENWLCKSCGLCNFKRRPKCFKCGVDGESPAVDSINVEPQESDTDTLIMRNIAPISSIDGILNMLSPYAILSASKVHLIDHKETGNNKGIGFFQLSSPLEASELLTILQSLQPPLKLDGKTLAVDYAKSSIRNGAQNCGKQATHISVASTAIPAAHWSSSQLQPGSDATSDFVTPPEGFSQQSQKQNYQVWQQQHLKGLSLVNGDGFPGADPDMSTYQYDKDSGYYYDPQTRLYYDPSSQYYYNSETQQYLYWDGEKQTYVQATEDMMAEQSSSSPEPKGKKKAKTRSSQQIAENMERWAKSLNRRKGSSKSSVQDMGPSKEEDKKCSSAADAGFSLFEEKQSRDFEMPSLMNEQFKILEQETKSDPFVSYNGDNEPEEGGMDGTADEEGRITDWETGVCLLCQRQFPTKDALLRHQQLSDLHKQNLEIQKRSTISVAEQGRRDAELKYRDRAAERRGRFGAYTAKKEFQPPANYGKATNNGPRQGNNIGNHRFQAMGWQEGSDLGHHQ